MLHQNRSFPLTPVLLSLVLLSLGPLCPTKLRAEPANPPPTKEKAPVPQAVSPAAGATPASPGTKPSRGWIPTPDSGWEIIGILGFLLASGAGVGLWRVNRSHHQLLETIEALDQRLRKFRTSQETSNLNRTTELASLQDSSARIRSDWQKDRQTLQSHASQIESLNYHYNVLKASLDRLNQLSEINLPAPQGSWSPTSPELGFQDSPELESTGEPDLPNCNDCVAALNRGDKALLRSLVSAELNITLESEEALQRGTSSTPTGLMEVHGGGSYLLVTRGDNHWLLPTVQTLGSFSANQPQKGIFDYKREAVTVPELLRAAEVIPTKAGWGVVNKGVVIVAA